MAEPGGGQPQRKACVLPRAPAALFSPPCLFSPGWLSRHQGCGMDGGSRAPHPPSLAPMLAAAGTTLAGERSLRVRAYV